MLRVVGNQLVGVLLTRKQDQDGIAGSLSEDLRRSQSSSVIHQYSNVSHS